MQKNVSSSISDGISHNLINLTLIAFILLGLAGKLLISLNLRLHSDDVYIGMVCLEMAKGHNFFLSGFYLVPMNTHLFNSILLFHLIPQIISNYDPTAIRLISYFIYLLIIAVFSFVVYKISHSITNPLIFAAFMANLDPGSYYYYSEPVYHIATLFFAGLLVILFFDMVNDTSSRLFDNNHIIKSIFFIVAINLLAFSDALIIAFFFIPFTICYVVYNKHKSKFLNALVLMLDLSVIFTYLFLDKIINFIFATKFYDLPTQPKNLAIILNNIALYVEGLVLLYSSKLYIFILDSNNAQIYSFVLLLCTFLIVIVCIYEIYKHKSTLNMPVYAFFLISIITIFVLFSVVFAQNITSTRYITYTMIIGFIILSLAYKDKNLLYITLVFIILIINSIYCIQYIGVLNYHPNDDQYELINYLQENNLKTGYGDYWDANLITYLSHEKITIRPIYFYRDGITPMKLLTSENWYVSRPETYFVILNQNYGNDVKEFDQVLKGHEPIVTYDYQNYKIYCYNSTDNIWLQ